MTSRWIILNLCAGVLMVGCSSSPGETGNPDASADGGQAFAAVQAIFIAANCARCHDPAHPVVLEAPTFVALPLTADAAYGALVGQPAHETCGGTLVTPGNPAASYLYHKLTDDPPCEGKRMPHPGALASRPPLADADLATIAAWIRGGAHR
jgi:hypothetical protein